MNALSLIQATVEPAGFDVHKVLHEAKLECSSVDAIDFDIFPRVDDGEAALIFVNASMHMHVLVTVEVNGDFRVSLMRNVYGRDGDIDDHNETVIGVFRFKSCTGTRVALALKAIAKTLKTSSGALNPVGYIKRDLQSAGAVRHGFRGLVD